ncbi:hypothetical protein UFOVP134_60 [uncultured Caudovirales phage]|uniref:Uncharacterized protein n=1 Tax=uncultured Caudovirales phage TaxID=2100421 RepID=A0A6J5LCD2_9CAUD|nr:hypothetical protein UFOVP134_60 [uncultured Caudovirales phage]
MPELPGDRTDFDAGKGAIQTNNIGMEAAVMAGRHIGATFHQIGQDVGQIASNYQYQSESSKILPALQGSFLAAQQQMNEAVKDPNNGPQAVADVLTKYDGWVHDTAATFGSPRARAEFYGEAARHADALTTYAHTAMTVQAGIQAQQSYEAANDQATSAAFNNFGNLEVALGDIKAAHDPGKIDPNGRLDVEQLGNIQTDSLKTQKQAVIGSIKGLILRGSQNPTDAADLDHAEQVLNDPGFHPELLDATDREQLTKELIDGRERQRTAASYQATQDEKALKDKGAGVYADLDARVQAQQRPGAAPDPTLAADVSTFTSAYGHVLPGESTSLQAGVTKIVTDQSGGKLVPDDTPVGRDMMTRLGTPQEATDAQISQAEYTHQISHNTAEMLRTGSKLAQDPANKEALEGLKRAQDDAATAILRALPGNAAAAAMVSQMRNDSQSVWNGWVQTEGPAQALEIMRNGNNPRNFFANTVQDYIRAAQGSGGDTGRAMARLKGMPDYAAFSQHVYGGGPQGGPTPTASTAGPPPPIMDVNSARFKQLHAWATGGQ